MTDARYYVVGDRSSSQSMPHKSSACGASAPMCAWWMMTTASNDASGRDGIEAAVPELGELLNDNDPSARAEALVALRNLAGKGTPPAELKSLSAHG